MPKSDLKPEDTHLVIMAGGIGSRFWPLSTPECPKQFIDILGCGKTLLQLTAERFVGIVPASNIWIVTSVQHRNLVYEQLPEIPKENIILEPCMRNTAPCIAYVGWKIKSKSSSANIIVTPSDHSISDMNSFRKTMNDALLFTAANDAILTIGITPDSPNTGYGYIAASHDEGAIKRVLSFKEKPTAEVAAEYLKADNYYWNSGMFVWKLSTLQESFKRYAPEIAAIFDNAAPYLNTEKETEYIKALYATIPKISVDYAIMEKADNIFICPADFRWSDLGTWGSLKEVLPCDS
ncbi:MAG: mannose-1-phosphate guanylyltransferase, partial [Bacteroidales bacterium]